jgi:DNA-binding transcriptional regulator YbjK
MRAASSQNVLATLADDELDQLAQDILQRVSQRLDAEIATALEARISEHLAAQVNAAVTHVLSDMRLSIANEIGDAVNAALADRLRNR